MTVKRDLLSNLYNTIQIIKKDQNIDITNKYYFLKIEKIVDEELKLTQQLFEELSNKYGEKTENGIKIKDEYLQLVGEQIFNFNETDIIFPDISFQIETFEKMNLTWEQLESLMPFIKN